MLRFSRRLLHYYKVAGCTSCYQCETVQQQKQGRVKVLKIEILEHMGISIQDLLVKYACLLLKGLLRWEQRGTVLYGHAKTLTHWQTSVLTLEQPPRPWQQLAGIWMPLASPDSLLVDQAHLRGNQAAQVTLGCSETRWKGSPLPRVRLGELVLAFPGGSSVVQHDVTH